MDIKKTQENGVPTIAVSGRLDTVTAPALDAELHDIDAAVLSLVLDFQALEYISSAGLRILLLTHKSMQKRGGSLTLKNVSTDIMEVLDMTGFSEILHFT